MTFNKYGKISSNAGVPILEWRFSKVLAAD